MSAEFSANLSSLRKERNISQKDAARDLGISQALLSHYEKGIRECNLEFVKKASEYYGVSADRLLGIRHTGATEGDIYTPLDLPSDSGITPKTLLRCLVFLSEEADQNGDAAQIFFDDFFTLCIRKYISVFTDEGKNTERLCDVVSAMLTDEIRGRISDEALPSVLALKTAQQHGDMLLAKSIAQIM